jgi:hypothetical protein
MATGSGIASWRLLCALTANCYRIDQVRDRWLWISLALLCGLLAIGLESWNHRLVSNALAGVILSLLIGGGSLLLRAFKRSSKVIVMARSQPADAAEARHQRRFEEPAGRPAHEELGDHLSSDQPLNAGNYGGPLRRKPLMRAPSLAPPAERSIIERYLPRPMRLAVLIILWALAIAVVLGALDFALTVLSCLNYHPIGACRLHYLL